MPDTNANPSAPTGTPVWVWIGVVVVLALAIAGGGYWWMQSAHKANIASKRPNLMGTMGDTLMALDTILPDQAKMCSAILARALDFGVLPPGASLASQEAKEAQPEGRYTCEAQGADGKYSLVIDTSCPGSQDKTCFALDSVTHDGAFVYQRRNS